MRNEEILNLCAAQRRTNYDYKVSYVRITLVPQMQERSDVLYDYASMLLLGEGSEATEPYNKYDNLKIIAAMEFLLETKFLKHVPE